MRLFITLTLSPVFFILWYAVLEYFLPTANGALISALPLTALTSYLYYTLRKRFSQLTERKKRIEKSKKARHIALLLANERDFCACFPHFIADNSYSGITEDKALLYLKGELKKSGSLQKEIRIASLNGITEGARSLIKSLGIEVRELTQDEILDMTKGISLPNAEVRQNREGRIVRLLNNGAFLGKIIKYGAVLIFLSILTPYKIYYIIFGLSLIALGIYQRRRLKRS